MIKVKELIRILEKHEEKWGDTPVMIYDEYSSVYRTINRSHIEVGPDQAVVIYCEED